jgi:hypothetical protein
MLWFKDKENPDAVYINITSGNKNGVPIINVSGENPITVANAFKTIRTELKAVPAKQITKKIDKK